MNNYDVYSKFDIQKHADNFINYLEVCISPEGEVHYAVPSHVEFLQNVLKQQCIKDERNYQQLIDSNVMYWPNCLVDLTGWCMLWNDMIYKPSQGLTQAQIDTLFALSTTHYTRMPHLTLYHGDI